MHVTIVLSARLRAVALFCLALSGCTGPLEPTTRAGIPVANGTLAGSGAIGSTLSGAALTAAQDGFYPLRAGNRWDHRVTSVYRLVPENGEPPPAEMLQYVIRRTVGIPVELGGRVYLPEEIIHVGPGGPWPYAVYYRQDASGLYEFGAIRLTTPAGSGPGAQERGRPSTGMDARVVDRLLAGRAPAEREAFESAAGRMSRRIAALGATAPGGTAGAARWRPPGTAAPYELTRLRYPLEPRATWAVGYGFGSPATAEVVGVESLDLPGGTFRGHRIRFRGGFLGHDDSSEIWFGPSGYLQSVVHVEEEATDPYGNVIGRWTFDQRETLLDLRLVGAQIAELPPRYYPTRK